MHIYAVGASRNIGYYAALRFLAKGDTVTIVVRNPANLEQDPALKDHVASGKARLFKADATSSEDMQAAWEGANQVAPVDVVLFTVGATTATLSLTKGFIVHPHDLCTRALFTVVRTIQSRQPNQPIPKLVALSSTGLTPATKRVLPLLLRPLYGWALHAAHDDKRGMESIIFNGLGQQYEAGQTPGDHIMPANWEQELRAQAPSDGLWGPRSVIIRAAFLTDGEGSGRYRAEKGDFSTYTVARRDVAHFIVEKLVPDWEKYEGGVVTDRKSVV